MVQVVTQSGTVRGTSVNDVASFLRIPFAQAERFAPPRPVPLDRCTRRVGVWSSRAAGQLRTAPDAGMTRRPLR